MLSLSPRNVSSGREQKTSDAKYLIAEMRPEAPSRPPLLLPFPFPPQRPPSPGRWRKKRVKLRGPSSSSSPALSRSTGLYAGPLAALFTGLDLGAGSSKLSSSPDPSAQSLSAVIRKAGGTTSSQEEDRRMRLSWYIFTRSAFSAAPPPPLSSKS